MKDSIKQFLLLNFPMKNWIICHPFTARKANIISINAKKISEEMIFDPNLDGLFSGGQVDAFRHIFWMATLTQQIGAKRTRSLGEAHEKGNKSDFDNKTLEDNYLPDFISCKMDLLNNEIGINIGKANLHADYESLKEIIKFEIISGNAFIIKRNKNKEFLSQTNKILKEIDYNGKWFNPKTIVKSDFQLINL